MVSKEEDFSGLNISEDRLRKFKAAVKEFDESLTPNVPALAAKYKIPVRSLYSYLKSSGRSTMRGKKMSTTERKVREAEVGALADEAEKITTIAFGLGSPIARRYLPLINHLLQSGKTLTMIATDLAEWYEMKNVTQASITQLQTENQMLKLEKKALHLKLEEASALASPNFRYLLRAKIANDFAKKILYWKARGLRVGRRNYEAFKGVLRDLDENIGGVEFVRVTISPEKIVALKKKHEVPDQWIREVLAKVRRS